MMHTSLPLLVILTFGVGITIAGWGGNTCEIEGLTSSHWMMGYRIKEPINDTHQGDIISFKTTHITAMEISETVYLGATWKDDILTIFVTEKFNKDFEREAQRAYIDSVRIMLRFECTSGYDSITISSQVIDINNHYPVFNQESYEFNFAMGIPAKFDITEFLSISATDGDFTNRQIYYSFESKESKYLYINRVGKIRYPDYLKFFGHLEAKTNLTLPIREELVIVATDQGEPPLNTTAKVTIVIDSITKTENNTIFVHPPLFTKNMYFAQYTKDHQLYFEEPLSIKFGGSNTSVMYESDYSFCFRVEYDSTPNEINVNMVQPLPLAEIEETFIILKIEVKNDGIDIPGKTNLLIHLPKNEPGEMITNNNSTTQLIYTFSSGYIILPTILCVSVVIIVVVVNLFVILIILKKQKENAAFLNPQPLKNPIVYNESINEFKLHGTIIDNEIKVPL